MFGKYKNIEFPLTGMEKINFSGGEPFLQDRGEYLGKLVRFCKEELALPSVSVVSNGSLIRERWFKDYGKFSWMTPWWRRLALVAPVFPPARLQA